MNEKTLLHRQLNKFNRGLERFSDWYGKVLARLSHRLSLTVNSVTGLCCWYRHRIPFLANEFRTG